MASTNKTANYQLSQFIGTDKPAWLGDYNTDMNKIDNQMKANADLATSASGSAQSASNAVGNLENLETTEKTNLVGAVNEVNTATGTAQNTANTAVSNSNTNALAIADLVKQINWNTFENLTFSGSVNPTSQNVQFACNEAKTEFKVYGQVTYNSTVSGGSNNITLTSNDTGLRPDNAIVVTGTSIKRRDLSNGVMEIDPHTITINPNGTITVEIPRRTDATYIAISFIACITILKSFNP